MVYNAYGVAQAAQYLSSEESLSRTKSVLEEISNDIFQFESIAIFFSTLIIALVAGRLIAAVLRRITKIIGNRADKTKDLAIVMQLRRLETLIVISIASIRILLVILGIYIWWTLTHEDQSSTALLGAGAILTIILSGALFNILRDIASGSAMMAEHWYGVGDHISIEPFINAQGVVERVSLRSTKIRRFSGEILWVNNKDIAGVSVTPKGVRTIAIELFVRDAAKGVALIEAANLRLPIGASVVASPLAVMTQLEVGHDLWHITAIGDTAPGREWLLDKFAIDILQELDDNPKKEKKILVHDPISRYADSEAERRFARTVLNARKSKSPHNSVVTKVALRHAAADARRTKRKAVSKAKTASRTPRRPVHKDVT